MSQPFQSKWLSWGNETLETPPLETARTDKSAPDATEPITWRRATPAEQCGECRELEARGVRVARCSTCDVRVVPA